MNLDETNVSVQPSNGFSSVPVVDLDSGRTTGVDRRRLAAELGEICHRVGFVILTGHGIADAHPAAAFDAARRFFALPVNLRRTIDKRQSRHFRGWEPEGAEYTNNRPDIREQIDLWSEHPARPADVQPAYLRLLGPNQWPPEHLVPGFRAAVERWTADARQLADELMQLLAIALDLDAQFFDRLFGRERMSLVKLIRYPATPPGQFGVNAHHDTGFLTLLWPGDTPGLQIRNHADEWIDVPIVPGAVVVNLGEMFQAVTGHYFVATPHRVVATGPRQSLGYFHGPALDTPLDPLRLAPRFARAIAASARHRGAGFMARRDETAGGVGDMASPHHPGVYGEQLWNYFVRSYPDNVARHYPDA